MTDATPTASTVRQPQQARSRAGWERVVAVGRDLLADGGYEALTISEVCRRARVTAPSLYARVDGRTGLFRAIYEDIMRDVHQSETELFALADPTVAGVVTATTVVFERHDAHLRAIIRQSVEDPWLLEQGAVESRRLLKRIAAALPAREPAATSAARAIYEACAFRTIYGQNFWADQPERLEQFQARLTEVAASIITTHD